MAVASLRLGGTLRLVTASVKPQASGKGGGQSMLGQPAQCG